MPAACDCRKETFLLSYQDLSNEVSSQHKDWAPSQVRLETARLFRPSYHQNMAGRAKELSGEEQYEGTDFIVNKSGEVFFKDGIRMTNILTFHENQRRLDPDNYSKEEHQTSMLIQEAFRSGATEVVTSYYHEGGQKDLVVMKMDPMIRKGKITIINEAQKSQMSFFEVRESAKQRFANLAEINPGNNVFILVDKSLSTEVIKHAVDSIGYAATRTAKDISRTFVELRDFLKKQREHQTDKTVIKDAHLADHITGSHGILELWQRLLRPQLARSDQSIKIESKDLNLSKRREEKQKSPEKSTAIEQKTKTPSHSQKEFSNNAFQFFQGVVFKEKNKKEIRKRKQTVLIETVHRLEEVVSDTASSLKKKGLFVEKMTKKTKENQSFRKIRRRHHRLERKFFSKEPSLLRLFLKESKAKIKKKEVLILKKEKLREALVTLVKRMHRLEIHWALGKNDVLIASSSAEKKRARIKEKKLVLRFAFAWVLWLFLRTNHEPKQRIDISIDRSKTEKTKELHFHQQSRWILLAIVWHLVMIREQRMSVANKKMQKKNKRKLLSLSNPLPSRAVIFAFQ